jgi:peptidoglycan/LPS O-acetylase OafA/YrhL
VPLAISWLAVFAQRGEPFDLGYIIFLQNYYQQIPFFLISWSLCIEEHFYLVLPAILVILPKHRRTLLCFFALLFLSAPSARIWESIHSAGLDAGFGYIHTATHLRSEGLILGFGLAYFAIFLPKQFKFLGSFCAMGRSRGWGFIYRMPISFPGLGLQTWSDSAVDSLAAVLVAFASRKESQLASSLMLRLLQCHHIRPI